MSALPSLGIAAVVLLGGHKVIDGDMSLGAFFAANGYMLMLSAPLRGVGMLVGQYQRAIAAGDRVFEVLDAERDLVEQPGAAPLPDGPGRISFDHVQFGYDETRPVLHDVNLEVAAGSTVALIGPTGCGKTTLTTLIPRFYDVAGGSVSVDGATCAASPSTRCASRWASSARTPSSSPPPCREHRLRRARGRRPTRSSRPRAGPGTRVHLRPARRLRDPRRRARADALGRPAPADRHRPRAPR